VHLAGPHRRAKVKLDISFIVIRKKLELGRCISVVRGMTGCVDGVLKGHENGNGDGQRDRKPYDVLYKAHGCHGCSDRSEDTNDGGCSLPYSGSSVVGTPTHVARHETLNSETGKVVGQAKKLWLSFPHGQRVSHSLVARLREAPQLPKVCTYVLRRSEEAGAGTSRDRGSSERQASPEARQKHGAKATRAARPTTGDEVLRKVDPSGSVSFAGTTYRAGNRYIGRVVGVRVVGDTVQITQDGLLLRTHRARHDKLKEFGALANPGGRPRRSSENVA
jgi:hypothetical protein